MENEEEMDKNGDQTAKQQNLMNTKAKANVKS